MVFIFVFVKIGGVLACLLLGLNLAEGEVSGAVSLGKTRQDLLTTLFGRVV